MSLLAYIPEKDQYTFPHNLQNKTKKINEEEKEIFKITKNYIEKNLWKWRIDNNFRFNLPPTIFEEKKIIDIPQNFQHKSIETEYASNNIVGNKFSPELLKKIWEDGQFEIESRQKGLPYTWKLSNLIIKGNKNVKLRYLKDMSLSFSSIYTLKNRFDIKKYCYFSISFFSSFYHLYLTIFDTLNLLVGMPLYRNNEYELTRKIKYEDLKKFIELNPHFIYKMFDRKIINEIIFKLDDDFRKKWNKEILPEKMKIYKQQKIPKSNISIKIQNDEKIEFFKFLTKNQNFQQLKNEFPSIEEFLQSQQIIINEKFKIDEEYEQKINNFEKELEKHSIKIFCSQWRNDKMNNFSKNLKNEQDKKLFKTIKGKIENKKDPSKVYSYNISNKENFEEKLNVRKKKEKSALVEYRASKLEIMPYEVKKRLDYRNKPYFYIDKKKYYYVQSNFFCWRVWLFLIKLYCAFCNYNIRVYRQMTTSMLGIKAFFLTELYRDFYANSTTGELHPCSRTYTFPRTICNLITWINDSRTKFENSPDTGILGKGISRIFNLILNYVIRLGIIGLLVLCLYPLFIIANICICFGLIIISPIITILWIILDYIFSSLIYNRYNTSKFLNLLRIIIKDFLINTVFQFIFCCLCLIMQPLLSLFFIIYAHIHYILRYFYDFCFYYILKYLGKVPLTDSCIAWRISGPHLFRERFYDISNRDLMSLVIAEIEKMVMNNYSKNMEKILDGPNNSLIKIKDFFNLLDLDIKYKQDIANSIEFYKKKLKKQIKNSEKYPELSSHIKVKFSEERLDNIKNLIEAYLRDYSRKNDLSFELNKYEDKNFEQLTENILKNIFGYNILETLDDVDKIVHLESAFENNLDEISQRIFENPKFDDRLFIEKRVVKEKEIKLPKIAYFRDVFNYNSDLFLNLDLLDEKERKKLLNKND